MINIPSPTSATSSPDSVATQTTTLPATRMSKLVPAEILPSRRLNVEEWLVDTPTVDEWAREFYRTYVGITDDTELQTHLLHVRRQAWEVYKYRCVGTFVFINYNLGEVFGRK